MSNERRASEEPTIRVRWSNLGDLSQHDGRLVVAPGEPSRARLLCPRAALEGEELRLEVLDTAGSLAALGVARVLGVAPGVMDVQVLALGFDANLLSALAAQAAARGGPPPIPGGRPPSLPGGTPLHKLLGTPTPPPRPVSSRATPGPRSLDDSESEELEALIEPLSVQRTGVIIGIDLGTTNTCASYVVDGRAKVIPGRTGTSTIPSMITFEPDGTFHIGQRAADRQVLHPTRTVYGTKRLLGRTFRPDLARELQHHFAYPLGEAEGQRFGVRIDDRVISMDTIAARLFDEVRGSAEAHLGQPVEAAVVTVPAYFSEVQREAVRRAAAQAKLIVYRIVNEPTAAAVAYGHKQQNAARIAVWDFGGGTFDFSVVDVSDGQLEVIATGGDNFVGGSDFDDAIASFLLEEFCRTQGAPFEPGPQQIARLRDAAEKAKCALSTDTETAIMLPEFARDPRRDLRVELSRARFEALTAPLVARTLQIANDVLAQAGLQPKDINDVVLVGGTTRVPAVQVAVAELFGRRPSKRINPDEAVALGAALLADEIGNGGEPSLLDILPMSVGRAVHGRRYEPIVARNERLPAQKELTVDADLLGSVYVPLFQGDSADAAQNEYLCSVLVEDRSLWDGGRVTIRLSFDEHAVMAVEAFDARKHKPLPVKLDRSRPVEDILRDLGAFEGKQPEAWQPPKTTLGGVLGKLFSRLRRA